MWKMMGDPQKFAEFKKANEADGYHNIWMFPLALEGAIYCLWEAKASKTKDDMEQYIKTNKHSAKYYAQNILRKLCPGTTLQNTVMALSPKLLGGPACVTVDEVPRKFFDFA